MTGQLLTEIILKKPLSIDISELSLERFKNATVVAYEKLVV